jgi:predicted RNase H-like HicB family nuclease
MAALRRGDTLEEVLEDARGAITSHLDALRDEGRPAPVEQPVLIATVSAA